MTTETHEFQSDVTRLLDIVVHALYSDRAVFLRELVSNAADACDKLRYLAQTDSSLAGGDYRITITPNEESGTLTITDNGIGMNKAELQENLGTIARSGTAAFLKQLEEAQKNKGDLSLIGQFGVGFYSAFMVADDVTVDTRKAGTSESWQWRSTGAGSYSISESSDAPTHGTRITLKLKDDAKEFLNEARLRNLVTTYSEHIAIPVYIGDATTPANEAGALWMRPKSEITDEQYAEFYRSASGNFDTPLTTLHWKAEGVVDYTALLFIPSFKPLDLYDPARASRVRLYVKRVFITENAPGLLPAWLRFLRGVIDSEDLPLNISREMLQSGTSTGSPIVTKIRQGVTKKVLSELSRLAEKEPESYSTVWDNYGAVLKEGLYESEEHRDALLKLVRATSTHGDTPTSLADYKSRMKDGQDAIYYLTGESAEAVKTSPHLEGFKARGIEVLLLTDPIDQFWVSTAAYEGTPMKSVTRGAADLDKMAPITEETPKVEVADTLVAFFKQTLGDAVKDVRGSARLTDSAAILVSDDNDVDLQLERLLRQHKQLGMDIKRILEINPAHPIISAIESGLAANAADPHLADAVWVLFEQARLQDGDAVRDPAGFARRLGALLTAALTSKAA